LVGAGRPPSSERSFWNGPVLSFEPDARLTDDRDPAVVVGLDDPTEPIWRNLHQLAADSLETLLEVGHGLRDRLLETSDCGRWGPGRSEYPDPGTDLRPGTPDSVMVGTSGACGFRFAVRIPMPLTWPDLMKFSADGVESKKRSTRPDRTSG